MTEMTANIFLLVTPWCILQLCNFPLWNQDVPKPATCTTLWERSPYRRKPENFDMSVLKQTFAISFIFFDFHGETVGNSWVSCLFIFCASKNMQFSPCLMCFSCQKYRKQHFFCRIEIYTQLFQLCHREIWQIFGGILNYEPNTGIGRPTAVNRLFEHVRWMADCFFRFFDPIVFDRCPAPTISQPFPNCFRLFPTVSDYFPTVSDCFPTVSDCFPTVSRLFPTVFRLFPTVSPLLPTVFRLFPDCLRLFPDCFRLCPDFPTVSTTFKGF